MLRSRDEGCPGGKAAVGLHRTEHLPGVTERPDVFGGALREEATVAVVGDDVVTQRLDRAQIEKSPDLIDPEFVAFDLVISRGDRSA
jgi:hypothetical protein